MNEKIIPFVLTEEQARLLDEMYLKNKSVASQMALLKLFDTCSDDEINYYVNTLIEEMFSKNIEGINKYLKAMMKDNQIPFNVLLSFIKVLHTCQHKVDEYQVFRKSCIVLFARQNFDYETILKDFLS